MQLARTKTPAHAHTHTHSEATEMDMVAHLFSGTTKTTPAVPPPSAGPSDQNGFVYLQAINYPGNVEEEEEDVVTMVVSAMVGGWCWLWLLFLLSRRSLTVVVAGYEDAAVVKTAPEVRDSVRDKCRLR